MKFLLFLLCIIVIMSVIKFMISKEGFDENSPQGISENIKRVQDLQDQIQEENDKLANELNLMQLNIIKQNNIQSDYDDLKSNYLLLNESLKAKIEQ